MFVRRLPLHAGTNPQPSVMTKQKRRLNQRIKAASAAAARIIYGMIASGTAYDENEAFKVTPSSLNKRILHLQKQAKILGFQLVAA